MAMKSMKLSKAEKKETVEAKPYTGPEYPYGLSISLDKEALDKLGISELPEVGTKLTLEAKVDVTGVSESSSDSGKDYRTLTLQITDMELGEAPGEDIGKKLYGK